MHKWETRLESPMHIQRAMKMFPCFCQNVATVSPVLYKLDSVGSKHRKLPNKTCVMLSVFHLFSVAMQYCPRLQLLYICGNLFQQSQTLPAGATAHWHWASKCIITLSSEEKIVLRDEQGPSFCSVCAAPRSMGSWSTTGTPRSYSNAHN